MATIGNAPVFPTQSVLPGNLQVTGNATISGTTNSVGALTENSNEVLNVTNTTFFGADQWYLNTNHTTNADITAWTRLTGDNGGNIGSAMSVSSGIFTFPTTGVWLVISHVNINNNSTSDDASYVMLKTSSDNFSTINSNAKYGHLLYPKSARANITTHSTYIFDCADTSNDKLKFEALSFSSGNYVEGFISGNTYRTWVAFVRLGGT